MHLHFGIARVTLADAIFHDAIADFVAVGHLDDMIAERARDAAHVRVAKAPGLVFAVEFSLVIALRPAVEAAIEPRFQKISPRQGANLDAPARAVGETPFKFGAFD